VFGETVIKQLDDFQAFFSFFPGTTTLAAKEPGKGQSAKGDCRWNMLDEFSVEESDFHQEPGDVLNLRFLYARSSTAEKSEPSLGSWMSQ
jgi:hypothetical protein